MHPDALHFGADSDVLYFGAETPGDPPAAPGAAAGVVDQAKAWLEDNKQGVMGFGMGVLVLALLSKSGMLSGQRDVFYRGGW